MVQLNTHTGTHCDAPWHFEDDGKRLDEVDSAIYFGMARLIDCGDATTLHANDLGPDPLPTRILLKTRNRHIPHDGPFDSSFTAVEEDAAQRMVDEGVKLVGIDYLSIAPFGNGAPTHHVLLRAEVFIVEGLLLNAFKPGDYQFTVLPLPLADADGAPCRAFIGMPPSA